VTDEQAIERGLAAASLLSDPTFQNVIASLGVEAFAVFTETKPDERQRREDTYNLYQGLKAIEAELTARVQAKDEAVARIDAINEDQDDLDGPLHIQGDNNQ
jgi:hypothetical protein